MKWQDSRNLQSIPLVLTGLLLAAQAHATETPAQKREKELQQRAAKNDPTAAALQKRVEQLESQVAALRAAVAAGSLPTGFGMVRTSALAQATPPSASPPASARPPAAASSGGASTAQRSGPGAFEVDEEAAQRALERTLTQAGALLLAPRTIEITPSYTYQRAETSTRVPITISTTTSPTPTLVLAEQSTRRNEHTARLDVRAGMPYNSQLELSLPYHHVRSSQTTDFSNPVRENGSGAGDITLGVAKTLMREGGWRPDLIGRLTYNVGNGKKQDGNVGLFGGYRQLQGELLAIKRQDPLAFVAGAFYGKSFKEDGINPGDTVGFSLSGILAASPATSLQLGFSQIYRREQEVNGAKTPGSSQTYGMINLGASSVLSRDVTLVTRFGIGLGNDAPKYNFTLSLPIMLW